MILFPLICLVFLFPDMESYPIPLIYALNYSKNKPFPHVNASRGMAKLWGVGAPPAKHGQAIQGVRYSIFSNAVRIR